MTTLCQTFADLSSATAAHGEHNDCTVKAVAVMLGGDYNKAHKAMAENGRTPRRGAYRHQTLGALEDLGFSVSTNAKEFLRGKTFATVERELRAKFPGTKFLVFKRRHVAAFDGEKLVDWGVGRRFRVQEVWAVREPDAPRVYVPAEPVAPVEPVVVPKAPRKVVRKPRVPVVANGVWFKNYSAACTFFGIVSRAHERAAMKKRGYIVLEGSSGPVEIRPA